MSTSLNVLSQLFLLKVRDAFQIKNLFISGTRPTFWEKSKTEREKERKRETVLMLATVFGGT